ncbi:MAG TPA: DUF4173 domain-containing protein [Gemmatimonadaceae bacterium]|nr:DUF4173 domain-containing protein [Gemmatimonadaceae bacterium]
MEGERTVAAPAARPLVLLWSAALLVAAAGVELLYDARPGIGWTIWTIIAAAGLALFAFYAHGRVRGPRLVPLALASALGVGAAVTANEFLHFLSAVSIACLLALAMIISADETPERVGPRLFLWTPLVAPLRAGLESVRRASETLGLASRPRSAPLVRGIALALPVVILFALLLSSADPVFAAARESVIATLTSWVVLPKLVFFTFLLVLSLGAFGVALAGAPVSVPGAMLPLPRMSVGATERLVLLGAVASLFAIFLVLQVSYLFGNAPAAAGSGVTFAEYARRGFAELTVAATLCAALILALHLHAARGARERTITLVELVLVGELLLLLVSAFRRVLLYEAAYGFTTARLYAQGFMVVLGVTLLVLARELARGLDLGRLTRAGVLAAAGALISLSLWNHEGWIVRRNVERYEATGKLDAWYLTSQLSANAVPATVEALPRLRPELASCVRTRLGAWQAGAPTERPDRALEWNLGRARAERALREAGITALDAAARKAVYESPVCRS